MIITGYGHLGDTIGQFRSLGAKRKRTSLNRLRRELDEAIDVARRTEERMAEWDQQPHIETELEQE